MMHKILYQLSEILTRVPGAVQHEVLADPTPRATCAPWVPGGSIPPERVFDAHTLMALRCNLDTRQNLCGWYDTTHPGASQPPLTPVH